eukprot:TRINITY_DN12072_c0_g1_i1.p1 TRINITY_DN12072_c0_g1~~TRINITY_DN12072_c0_g1_i1.p1  ORF type:complete len:330 (+),score=44.04 TRINITY_DN12072_c0_g1_i1:327-1316(+)
MDDFNVTNSKKNDDVSVMSAIQQEKLTGDVFLASVEIGAQKRSKICRKSLPSKKSSHKRRSSSKSNKNTKMSGHRSRVDERPSSARKVSPRHSGKDLREHIAKSEIQVARRHLSDDDNAPIPNTETLPCRRNDKGHGQKDKLHSRKYYNATERRQRKRLRDNYHRLLREREPELCLLLRKFYREIHVADRVINNKICKQCFNGRRAVSWLWKHKHNLRRSTTQFDTREQSVLFLDTMIQRGYIFHVFHTEPFKDSRSLYYRFDDKRISELWAALKEKEKADEGSSRNTDIIYPVQPKIYNPLLPSSRTGFPLVWSMTVFCCLLVLALLS